MSTSALTSGRSSFLGWLMLTGLIAGVGAIWFWRETRLDLLTVQLRLAREEVAAGMRGKAETQQLAASFPGKHELQRLREEAAAGRRLSQEVDALQTRARQLEREAAVAEKKLQDDSPSPPPALRLALTVTTEGDLTLDGAKVAFSDLKQRLGGLPPGANIDLRVIFAAELTKDRLDVFQREVKQFMQEAYALGYKSQLRLERP